MLFSIPPIDFSIFEGDRFYKHMRGKVYRMLPVETHKCRNTNLESGTT
jgi:hypothetical protein